MLQHKKGSQDTPPTPAPFAEKAGPNITPPIGTSPVDYLGLLLDDGLWAFLVERTNAYARRKLGSMQLQRRSLYRNWRDVTVEEMKGMVSVILNMGIVQMTNLKDYWSTDDTCNFSFFR